MNKNLTIKKGVITSLILVVLIVSSLFIVRGVVNSYINNAEIIINKIEITNSTSSSLEMKIEAKLDKVKTDIVVIENIELTIIYKSYVNHELTLEQNDITMEGSNLLLQFVLPDLSEDSITGLLNDLLEEESLEIDIEGTTTHLYNSFQSCHKG